MALKFYLVCRSDADDVSVASGAEIAVRIVKIGGTDTVVFGPAALYVEASDDASKIVRIGIGTDGVINPTIVTPDA